jgi:hypothetical protein
MEDGATADSEIFLLTVVEFHLGDRLGRRRAF